MSKEPPGKETNGNVHVIQNCIYTVYIYLFLFTYFSLTYTFKVNFHPDNEDNSELDRRQDKAREGSRVISASLCSSDSCSIIFFSLQNHTARY